MTNLLIQDAVYTMCRTVGFAISPARTASAIAMVESAAVKDGRPYADADLIGDQELATTVWGFSYGLFQIRSLRAQKGTGGYRDEDILLNPMNNCRSAYAVYQIGGFEPWSTFKSGQYKAFLQSVFPPVPGTYIVISGDTLSGIGAKLGIEWRDLAVLNAIPAPYPLRIGQVLQLPFKIYKVVAGDTLSKIAAMATPPTTWQRLAEYNHLANPNLLGIGQVIRIPVGGMT